VKEWRNEIRKCVEIEKKKREMRREVKKELKDQVNNSVKLLYRLLEKSARSLLIKQISVGF
jgi:hypothetical protein